MAVSFLTAAQRDRYGRYPDVVTPDDLSRCFHLSDDDRAQIMSCRGDHNRLGFALQLTTVRYLGTFLDDPIAVPSSVLQSLSHQLAYPYPRRPAKLSQGRTARGACNKDPQTLWLRRHHRAAGGLPNDALALRRVLDRHRTAGCAVRPRHRLAACPQDSTARRHHAGALRRQRARPGRSPSISAVDAGDHRATERPVATAAARAGGRSGFFARPDSLGADAHQRSGDSRVDRSIERRACAGYHRTDEGPNSVEPDRVLGALRQPRQGSGHQPHANVRAGSRRSWPSSIVWKPLHRTRCWKCWRCYCTTCSAKRSRLIRRHGCGRSRIWTNRLPPWQRPVISYWIPMCRMKACVRKCSRKFHEQHWKTLLSESLS